jgi:hypothetical protein
MEDTPGTAGTIPGLDVLSITMKAITPKDHLFIEIKNKQYSFLFCKK